MKADASEKGYADFINPVFEIRRIFAETWGTFLLVFFSCGIKMMAAQSADVSPVMEALVPGAVVMIVIYFMGSVSGAHLNPCVTLAFAMRGNFPWQRVGAYLVAQIGGAVLAALSLKSLFGPLGQLGATVPAGDATRAFLMEIILTTGLVNTILGTASGARNIGPNGGIAVGAYIALAHMLTAPLNGTSMNPARSLGPDLIRGDLGATWIYVLGPFIGSWIAVGFEYLLKGKETIEGTKTAQGLDNIEKKI